MEASMNLFSVFGTVNYLAVAACMVASILVGSLWYSPKTFFPIWWKGIGKGDATPGGANMALIFGLTFVASYVKALGLAVAILLIGPAVGGITLVNGLLISLGAWALFVAPTYLTNNLFAGWGPKVYLIMVGNHLVDFLAAGVILSLLR